MLGIGALLDRKPAQLSGGERQRVALGRALLRKPQAFLLDEPLSNLDAALRTQMRFELKRIHAQFPVTTVYVTHDQVEAMTMADRIALMNHGELQQVRHPRLSTAEPANVFVAGFIGSPKINLVPPRSTHSERGERAALPRDGYPRDDRNRGSAPLGAERNRHHRNPPGRHPPPIAQAMPPDALSSRHCRGHRTTWIRDAHRRPRR